jgi:hypothetical protein
MTWNLRIGTLVLTSLVFTAACDKKSKKKDNLPANTGSITAESLNRSQTLSKKLAPALTRSFQGLSQVNPTDKMNALWNAVAGRAAQALPEESNPVPALRSAFDSRLALQNSSPLQKLNKAISEEEPEELFNDLMENILQEKHADFMADDLIYYRLDGLKPICDGDDECVKTLQSFRLGVGALGDEGLILQVLYSNHKPLSLRLNPSYVGMILDFDSVTPFLREKDEGLLVQGSLSGSLYLHESKVDLGFSLNNYFLFSTKDPETGKFVALSFDSEKFGFRVEQNIVDNTVSSTLKVGGLKLISAETSLEIPELDLNTTASEKKWNFSAVMPRGSFMWKVQSEESPSIQNTLNVTLDEDFRILVESTEATSGHASIDATDIHVKANGRDFATLSISPDVKAKLGVEGIRIEEGSATLVVDGQSHVLLKPQTCYRPVLDESEDAGFDNVDESTESFLDPVPCQS